MRSQTAARTESSTGTRDEPEFFGPRASMLFGCRHRPIKDPVGGVVVCSSVRAEFETNYRREILLGRALAAHGIAVQRFQYRGTGNSDGDASDVTLETMHEDAQIAADRLVQTTGVKRIAFMGVRLSSPIATAMAATYEGSSLVLWQPVTDPARYFNEVMNARELWALKEGAGAEPGSEDLSVRIAREGTVDMLGYPFNEKFYNSVMRLKLHPDPRVHDVLVLQLGARRLRREFAALAEAWSGAGSRVDCTVVEEQELWWIEPGAERHNKRIMTSTPAVRTTTEWLLQKFN